MSDDRYSAHIKPVATKPREVWLDVAKGISIISVVLFHAGALSTEGTTARRLWDIVDLGLFTFIMPLFFLVSGLVLGSALSWPFNVFLKRKVWPIAYLFVVWGGIYALLNWISGDAIGSTALATVSLQSVLWYLGALALYMVIAWLTRSMHTGLVLGASAMLAVPFAIYFPFEGWGLAHGPHFLVFFLVGCRLPRQVSSRIKAASLREVSFIAVLAIVFAVAAYLVPDSRALIYAAAPLVSVPAILIVSQFLLRWRRIANFIAKLGVASLAIFVVHTLVLDIVRFITSRSTEMPELFSWIAPILGTVLAVAVAMALWSLRRNLTWLFRPPYRETR